MNRFRLAAKLSLLTLLLSGCVNDRIQCVDEPTAPDCTSQDAGPDTGPNDAGRDTGPGDGGADAGPCGRTCPAAMPVCNETSGTCVQCLGAGDCSAPTAMCDTTSNMCVACLGNTDCTDPAMARCDAGACVPCDDTTQCAGITGTEVCNTTTSTCVECVGSTDCSGTDTCDLLANLCVNIIAESLAACRACTNDEQCAALHRCVPMQFMGVPRDPGYYCLRELDAPGSCPNPFTVGTPERMSLNGAAMERYCAIDEDTVTCEAVRGLLDDWRCDTGVDGRCFPPGEPGMAIDIGGARCEDLDGGGLMDRCTYSCGAVSECPMAAALSTCDGSPTMYCGGP